MLKKLLGSFDEYNLKARVYPTLILLSPVFLLVYTIIQNKTGSGILLSLVGSSLATFVLLYLLSDLVRNLGKIVENKIYGNELSFPTTEILMHKNAFLSAEKKRQVFEKMKRDFDFDYISIIEGSDEISARKRIKEVVGLIRQKVKDGRLLIGYNIRYGFWRNLIGTSLFSCFFCLIDLIIFWLLYPNMTSLIISIGLFIFYLTLYIFRKNLLGFFGFQYAEQLLLEYLSN